MPIIISHQIYHIIAFMIIIITTALVQSDMNRTEFRAEKSWVALRMLHWEYNKHIALDLVAMITPSIVCAFTCSVDSLWKIKSIIILIESNCQKVEFLLVFDTNGMFHWAGLKFQSKLWNWISPRGSHNVHPAKTIRKIVGNSLRMLILVLGNLSSRCCETVMAMNNTLCEYKLNRESRTKMRCSFFLAIFSHYISTIHRKLEPYII